MNNFEDVIAEETSVEWTEEKSLELSILELDMVGGGAHGVFLQ